MGLEKTKIGNHNSLTLQRHWTPLNCAIHLAQRNNCKSNKQCARTIVVVMSNYVHFYLSLNLFSKISIIVLLFSSIFIIQNRSKKFFTIVIYKK